MKRSFLKEYRTSLFVMGCCFSYAAFTMALLLLTGCKKELDLTDDTIVEIPDEGFETYLIDYKIDSDQTINGKVRYGEIKNVKSLFLIRQYSFPEIKSLKGLEYFTDLTSLDCTAQGIDELDVSKNKKLTYLNCSSDLSTGEGYTPPAQIKKLTFGKDNTELTYLNCNRTALTKLNISNLINLQKLYCGATALTELNVSANKNLKYCRTYSTPTLKSIYVYSLSQVDSTGQDHWEKDQHTVYRVLPN